MVVVGDVEFGVNEMKINQIRYLLADWIGFVSRSRLGGEGIRTCAERAYALCVPASFPLIYCAAVNKWAAGHFANCPYRSGPQL